MLYVTNFPFDNCRRMAPFKLQPKAFTLSVATSLPDEPSKDEATNSEVSNAKKPHLSMLNSNHLQKEDGISSLKEETIPVSPKAQTEVREGREKLFICIRNDAAKLGEVVGNNAKMRTNDGREENREF